MLAARRVELRMQAAGRVVDKGIERAQRDTGRAGQRAFDCVAESGFGLRVELDG